MNYRGRIEVITIISNVLEHIDIAEAFNYESKDAMIEINKRGSH